VCKIIIFYAISEVILLLIDIESNIRRTNELLEKLLRQVNLTNSKIEDLTDAIDKLIQMKTQTHDEIPGHTTRLEIVQQYFELAGLEPDLYDYLIVARHKGEVRVRNKWITNKNMVKLLYSSMEKIGFGRHVDGEKSFWSNKIPIKKREPENIYKTKSNDWSPPTKTFDFPSSV